MYRLKKSEDEKTRLSEKWIRLSGRVKNDNKMREKMSVQDQ